MGKVLLVVLLVVVALFVIGWFLRRRGGASLARTRRAGVPREARPRPVGSYELFRAAESLAACELRSWRAPVSALAISPAEIPESRASSWRPKPFLNLRLRSCFPFIFSPFSKGRSPAPLGSYTPNPLKSSPGRKCKSPLQQPLILRGLFSCAATILDGRTPLHPPRL